MAVCRRRLGITADDQADDDHGDGADHVVPEEGDRR